MEHTKPQYPQAFQTKLDAFPDFAAYFERLDMETQEELIQIFLDDKRIFPATFDTVFKFVFDPKRHPERLSRFLSLLLKQNITVIAQLPSETHVDSVYAKGIILDILVQLEDGSLADVEMQQITLDFPTQRAAVHSARLINQQYQTIKAQKKKDVRYIDVRKVYTIVFFVDDANIFHSLPTTYLHHSKHRTAEGLELDLLQEYFFVELRKFEQVETHINTEEKAWLKLLMASNFDTLQSLSENFPALQDPAKDVILFSKQTKEVPRMIWDTDEYVIKDMLERVSKERDVAVALNASLTLERDILRLAKKQYTPEQIAAELSVSEDLVQDILNAD